MQARIYAIVNRKGGSGKTSTTMAMASGLGRKGLKVLAVDLDPQGDLSDWSRCDAYGRKTIYEVLLGQATAKEAIAEAGVFDIIPANETLSLAHDTIETDKELAAVGVGLLRRALREVRGDYDVILIDTPPYLGFLSFSALVAAKDGVIIPVDNSKAATKGMLELSKQVASVKESGLNENLRYCGVLVTRYSARMNAVKVAEDMRDRVAAFIDAPLYKTMIRYSSDIPFAMAEQRDIFDLPRKNAGTQDYGEFIDEFIEREGLL